MTNSWRQRWARLVTIGATALMIGTSLSVVLPSGQPVAAAGEKSVKLAWFSNEPKDGTSAKTLASKINHVFLASDKYGHDLRKARYDGKIMQYKLAAEVEGPGPYANSTANCNTNYRTPMDNQIANKKGDFCRYVHPNESWFLHNGKGERLVGKWRNKYYYHMNPASSGWQAFARERLEREIASRNFNGIHFDNVELSITLAQHQLVNSDGVVKEYTTEEAFRGAWVSYFSSLSSVRAKGGLWANLIADRNTGSTWEDYLPHLDGAMVESFATGYSGLKPDVWDKQLSQYESALRQGKSVIALSQGEKSDTTRQTFALASYLLITDGEDAYFRYSNSRSYTHFWDYDNYDVALGAPQGARYQTGSSWRRDFANGYVVVDPTARTGKIVTTSGSNETTPAPSPTPSPTPEATPEPQPVEVAAPSVSLKGVTDGQQLSGTVTIEAVSSSAIERVEFFLDGTEIGSEGTAPYFLGGDDEGSPYGFDTRQWSDGSHIFKVVATDATGQTGSTQLTFTVRNTTKTEPAITVKGLADGQTVSGLINVEALVDGGDFATRNIKFSLDGAWVSTEGTAPYVLGGDENGAPNGFDTRAWSNGQHTFTVVATDTDRTTIERDLTITVQNNTASAIKLIGLHDGQNVSGSILVEGMVTDETFETRNIRFFLDGAWVGTEGTAPYYLGGDENGTPNGFDTREWSNGSHVFTAVAADTNGKTLETEITITVAN